MSAVTEIATVTLKPGEQENFEKAIAEAYQYLRSSPGYLSHELKQCVEQSDRYVLTIQWETLEAHTVTFRESENFAQWRACIGQYFAQPPEVLHYRLVTNEN
ncbi:MAG: antibiotic biosynthesis monooxygenase family protein [Cyanobacteria bacterium J06639_1]